MSLVVSTTNIFPNIVHSAPDDIQNSDKIRSLLKDIREVRQAKSREGLQKIDHSELSVRDIIIYHPICAFIGVTSCQIFVLWKSMKYGPSSCAPWACSRSLPAILQPTHENSAFDFTSIIHFVLQAYMYLVGRDRREVIVPFPTQMVTRTFVPPGIRPEHPVVPLTDVFPSQYSLHLTIE